MQTVAAWARHHPVVAYFTLTFIISWGGVLALGSPYGMPATSEQFGKAWPVVFLPYFFGPVTASLVLTALVDGRAGSRRLLSRFGKWRVDIRWYAVAILTAPLLTVPILLLLSLVSRDYLPAIFVSDNRPGLIVMGLVVGLVFGGLFEEPGWTGFAVPKLREHYSILGTGLIVGTLHGVWHFLPTFWGSGDASGALSLTLFLPPCLFYAGVLPAYRVLMVDVYDHTESLPVSMLMHASLTASTLFILAPSASGTALAMYYGILTVVVWGIVALVRLTKHGLRGALRTKEAGVS